MRVGVVYPQIELGGDPDAVRRLGQAVEDLGYDHLLAYDHVLGAVQDDRDPPLTGSYDEHDPFHDPFVLFSYLAGRTERLAFVTGILVLPQRQTALVAKQAADLAVLSGGRLRLGVAVGWSYVEYEALGQDFSVRGARLDEQIGLLRRLWSEPVVEFEGRFDRIDRAGVLPQPATQIPIWVGGLSEPAFRRGSRLGDGFIFAGQEDAVTKAWKRVRELLEERGRPVAGFGAEAIIRSSPDPKDVVRQFDQWADLGGSHASVHTMGLGFDSVDDHIDYITAIAAARTPVKTS